MDRRANDETPPRAYLIDELSAARDMARLELRLLTMDARQRWRDLEPRLREWEQNLDQSGEAVTEALSHGVQSVARTVSDFLDERPELRSRELLASARDVMRHDVQTCLPSDNLGRAAQLMWETDCGAVPVVTTEGTLVGMITDRDIAMACLLSGKAPSELLVLPVMSKRVYSCAPTDSVRRALRIMSHRQVRRLPVVSTGSRLVGIITLADLVRHVEPNEEASRLLTHTLASISEQRPKLDAAAPQPSSAATP